MSENINILKKPLYISIDENVFLGTTALIEDNKILKELDIKRVLIISPFKTTRVQLIPKVFYKSIKIFKHMKYTIIFTFEETFTYINESQTYGENIIVLSQESEPMNLMTVTAFIMKKHQKSAVEALEQILQRWGREQDIDFESLNLWQHMNYRLDSNNPSLRRYIVNKFLHRIKEEFLVEEIQTPEKLFFEISIEFLERIKALEENDIHFESDRKTYHCSRCDSQLFTERNVIKNDVKTECPHVFVEPINIFLAQICQKIEEIKSIRVLDSGPLLCPTTKCNVIIGSYCWDKTNACKCERHNNLEKYLIFKVI